MSDLKELIQACLTRKRIERSLRGMIYRGTKRGGISVAEVTQRLLAQYPTDLDEATPAAWCRGRFGQ